MMQKHEKEQHVCPEGCEACKAIKSGKHEIFLESGRRKYSPDKVKELLAETASTSTSPHSREPEAGESPAPAETASSGGSKTPSLADDYVGLPLYRKLSEDQRKISEGMLIHLPRNPVVHEILEQYLHEDNQETIQKLGINEDLFADFVHGIEVLFNVTLGRALLYVPERVQYARLLELRSQMRVSTDPSMFYGVEHLARLLVWIPEFMINFNDISSRDHELVLKVSSCLLSFISSHVHEWWTTSYVRGDSSKSHRH